MIPLEKGRTNGAFCFAAALAQMLLLAGGLCWATVGGLDLPAERGLLYGGIAALCVLFTAFFFENWLTGARIYGAAAIVLVSAAVVLFQQRAFLSGFRQLGCAVLKRMNSSYGGDYMLPAVEESGGDVSVFLLLCFIPVTAYLGAAVVYSADMLMTGLLVFPLTALLRLSGGELPAGALMGILLGCVSVLASGRVGNRRSLWGKRDSPQWRENRLRRGKVRAASAAVIVGLCAPLAVVSFGVLMPSLSTPIGETAPFAAEVKGRFAQMLLSVLPDNGTTGLSAPVVVSGGGVEDGNLHNSEGYLISGVEDLRIRVSEKPGEAIYLRGFIGGSYSGGQWLEPDGTAFAAAAANWDTEGDPAHYLYDLPFLRMLYEEQENGADGNAAELTVERINANDRYTYLPYGGYLNDYYQITGGDGGVMGQSVQDDVFPFYFRADQMQSLDEEFFLQNESTLDKLERAYAAFARECYTDLPEGFSRLREQCDAAGVDGESLEAVIGYIQEYLAQNCRYSLSLPETPEGEDPILFFLYGHGTGCSPQFASAATMLFRAFGIPARYVAGYAASQSLFTAQPDGSYQAVLQSEDAHAWVEIYISGVGWMPVETTPGTLGLVQDVPYLGNDLTPETTASTETAKQTDAPQEAAEKPGKSVFPAVMVLLVILAMGSVAVWRRQRIRDLGLDRTVPAAQRVRFIFAAYYRRLLWAGMPEEVESTSGEFARWVKKLDPGLGEAALAQMMHLVLESCFGQEKIHEKDVEWMRGVYRAARARLRRLPKEKKKA